jgi:hypothetical protein
MLWGICDKAEQRCWCQLLWCPPVGDMMYHHRITTASLPHHHRVTVASPPHHHRITAASPPHHHRITTASPPHHRRITTASHHRITTASPLHRPPLATRLSAPYAIVSMLTRVLQSHCITTEPGRSPPWSAGGSCNDAPYSLSSHKFHHALLPFLYTFPVYVAFLTVTSISPTTHPMPRHCRD